MSERHLKAIRMTDSAGTSQSDKMLDLSSGNRALSPGLFRSAPCSSGGPARLASLRTRDMTLVGAPKKPRRTFEPNVHVVRKSKDELKVQMTTSPKQRLDREEKRKERRVVKREKPRIIQSHSIFEQGPAACTRRTGRGTTLHESSSPLCDQLKREPEEDSHAVLSKLYRDDFIDDPTLRNSSKLKPIQLPLKHTQSVTAQGIQGRNVEVCQAKQPSLVELFSDLHVSGRDELFFMQLPDCMPVKTVGPRPPDTASYGLSKPAKRDSLPQGKAGTSLQTQLDFASKRKTKTHEETFSSNHCINTITAALHGGLCCLQEPVLSSFSEGLLGKLQLRKSGKVVLKLGDISMDVTEGGAFSFLQLVSVRLSEGRSGDMMVLGNVSHKLVLSPVFQTLLDQSETKSS
ncbi:DNA-directed RNA polymerase III subunit RPC4 isoform X2 [Boleophthalmus pectinirostris]|uniref:DNA-directed RNA polymerase III subunit RPC4 isoform X2 n=1 Tax=Boleophthalmus pectinirostris TaxID=150288 RepID=UPI002430A76E|nr:DNA-directed RNA polymerase III subunit RPC4 isoform X2 [Boleophthalmus pectinirostris]